MRHALFLLLALTWACAAGSARPARVAGAAPAPAQAPAPAKQASGEASSVDRPQYPSTYQRHTGRPGLIRNATIMTAAGPGIPNGADVLPARRIGARGAKGEAPADAGGVGGTREEAAPGLIGERS